VAIVPWVLNPNKLASLRWRWHKNARPSQKLRGHTKGWRPTGWRRAHYEEAIAMARQAREMAEQLGLTDVISDALDTEAKAIRDRAGDWAMLMEAALESALSGGHEEQTGRAFARAYMWYCDDLRPEEAERCYGDAFAYCEEHDIGTFVVCLQGQRTAEPVLIEGLDCPYQAALALLDTNEEIHLRESLTRLVDLGADATARPVRRTMRDLGYPLYSCRRSYGGKGTPARPHGTRAGDSPAPFSGPVQRGGLRQSVHLGQDRRTSRVGNPRQAGDRLS
jgi:hypothetical protein